MSGKRSRRRRRDDRHRADEIYPLVLTALIAARDKDWSAASDAIASIAENGGGPSLFGAACAWMEVVRQLDPSGELREAGDWVLEVEDLARSVIVDSREVDAEAQHLVLASQILAAYLNNEVDTASTLFMTGPERGIASLTVILNIAAKSLEDAEERKRQGER